MKLIKLYFCIIFILCCNISGYCFEWEDLEIVKRNSEYQRKIIGYMKSFYINELEYQKIKKKADNFKNTNYMVYDIQCNGL